MWKEKHTCNINRILILSLRSNIIFEVDIPDKGLWLQESYLHLKSGFEKCQITPVLTAKPRENTFPHNTSAVFTNLLKY